ncbi:MAG: hypothetical protein JWP01_200 [Myxococcales bacterium]|nr:hypothetical protein [Myxococcales bacterium]
MKHRAISIARGLAISISLCGVVTCAGPDVTVAQPPSPIPADATPPNDAPIESALPLDALVTPAVIEATPGAPEVWLKGSTHVHARPSGDSTTPIPEVLRWYEDRRYDFIVLTDHNQVSEIDRTTSTQGQVTLRPAGDRGLIVFAGIELTHNPSDCIPAGDASGKCRIHVNLLGVPARPAGKVEWANRKTHERLLKYEAALETQKSLGGIAQINHSNWFWGMTGDLLADLGRRGFALVEISNMAFSTWNAGDKDHPSLDAIWDAALAKGVTLWGVASDDAHDYSGKAGAKYPAGGGWITVKAARDPQAILAAIAAGRFYASTGVVLARAEVDHDELVVEVDAGETGTYTIEFIENGTRVGRVKGRSARRAVPQTGYVRALVTRDDGTRAWVQPARR